MLLSPSAPPLLCSTSPRLASHTRAPVSLALPRLGSRPQLQPAAVLRRQQHACPLAPTRSRAHVVTRAAAADDLNPMKAFQKELGIQSNKLDQGVKERVEAAIAALGYRVTVGEVAARAGVKISEADEALKALAFDSLGALEVSREGEVVYAFDRNFVSKIRSRSWWQRLQPLGKKAREAGLYLTRVAFGTALIASVVVVWLAILALSSSRDSDNRRSGGYYGGGNVWFNPFDIWIYWDPRYSRRTRERIDSGEGMSFVEAIFSFVFGDGDPNMTFEERRWRGLGQHIQNLGGVVSAEEMAPFLDPPPLGRSIRPGPNKYEDESFVLPALIRFGGEPFVDEEGCLLYKFPALQVGAGGVSVQLRKQEVRVPLEKEWEFSAATPGQQTGALALGVFNVIGVLVLSTMLADPYAKLALFRQGLGFILGLVPGLQAYAAAFFAIPLLRAFVDGKRNLDINARNDGRLQAVDLLQARDPEVVAKSEAARKLGERRVIGQQDVVYTTEQATGDQVNLMEEEEFDKKMGVFRGRKKELGDSSSAGRRVDDVFGRGRRRRERSREEVEVDWSPRQGRGSSSSRNRRNDDWDRLDRW